MIKGRTIKILNEEIFYVEKNIDALKTVLFIHGFNSSHAFMNSLLNVNHKYNIIALDLPGNGNSTCNDIPTVGGYQEIVMAFIEQLPFEEIIVVGHSLGAASAAYASVHSEKVKKIVLLSAINPYMIGSERIRDSLKTLLQPTSLETAIISISTLISNQKKKNRVKNIIPLSKSLFAMVKSSKTVFKKMISEEILNKNFLETKILNLYKNIKIPALIIHGNQDYFISINCAKKLASEIDAPITIIDKCGHAPVFEYPHLINALLNQF